MIALAIVLAVLILIALLRFGVTVEYSEQGFAVSVMAGPLNLRVLPRKAKKKKAGKKAAGKTGKKAGKKAKKDKKETQGKPGGLQSFLDIFKTAKKALSRLRRRLLIKRLTIHYVAANDDPSKAALAFGRSSAVINALLPSLKKYFRIRRHDLRTSADFDAAEPRIYVKAAISLAVWETIYIMIAFVPLLLAGRAKNSADIKGKEEQDNGKAPDK